MPSLIDRLARTGLRRGLLHGSRGWWYLGVTAAAIQVARRLLGERPETVFESEIKPGKGVEIRTVKRREHARRGARTRR